LTGSLTISAASWPSEPSDESAAAKDDHLAAPADIVIEPIEARHADALAELFEQNRASAVSDTFDPFPLTDDEARRIALEPRLDAYFIASRKAEPIAMSMLRGFDEGFAIPSFGIFVDHRHHGGGVGRRLTAWTVEEARRRGCAAIRLSVYASNEVAVRLYRSLGFAEQERAVVARATGRDEKILMTRSLED
jgi:ribosomal-protein-alanine N-acetyltransferase